MSVHCAMRKKLTFSELALKLTPGITYSGTQANINCMLKKLNKYPKFLRNAFCLFCGVKTLGPYLRSNSST